MFSIKQNSDCALQIDVNGMGYEPRIEFDKTLVEFTPILPFSAGCEAEVSVHNPCPYPLEFYSLEFDKQYLYEEEVCVCVWAKIRYTV